MPVLATKNLSKQFAGVKAVNDLSLGFEKGKITGIVGPNGSGKTTLVNLLSGLLKSDHGLIVISDAPLRRVHPWDIAHYGITRTFQQVRLFNQMSVLDNILVVLTERKVLTALFEKHNTYHRDRAKEILEKIGLWEKKNELAGNLSYGQRKLLEIGRALATDADIFLFDEPMSGLFPEMVKTVSSIMRALRDGEKTVVLIEHDMAIIRELCDHIFVLDSGVLLAEGKPDEVLSRKEVTEAYLGE